MTSPYFVNDRTQLIRDLKAAWHEMMLARAVYDQSMTSSGREYSLEVYWSKAAIFDRIMWELKEDM